jgi:HEPN domain-containing protein
MYLGIDQHTNMVFEGNDYNRGHMVWPLPMLAPAKFILSSENNILPARYESYTEYLFREDTFDPVTRVRRGRFYKRNQTQPERWIVMNSAQMVGSAQTSNAYTYFSCPNSEMPAFTNSIQHLVVLGTIEAFSLWTIINRESIHTCEIVFTLKARQSMGALPAIDWAAIPDKSSLLKEKLEGLADDIYRAGSDSVVDRSREAATAILSAYLQSEGIAEAGGKDLGELIDMLDKRNGKNQQRIVRCAAEIPQRLHSRAKHAEQEKRDELRPIRDQDAALAVQCIGVMLCDLGWAKW